MANHYAKLVDLLQNGGHSIKQSMYYWPKSDSEAQFNAFLMNTLTKYISAHHTLNLIKQYLAGHNTADILHRVQQYGEQQVVGSIIKRQNQSKLQQMRKQLDNMEKYRQQALGMRRLVEQYIKCQQNSKMDYISKMRQIITQSAQILQSISHANRVIRQSLKMQNNSMEEITKSIQKLRDGQVKSMLLSMLSITNHRLTSPPKCSTAEEMGSNGKQKQLRRTIQRLTAQVQFLQQKVQQQQLNQLIKSKSSGKPINYLSKYL